MLLALLLTFAHAQTSSLINVTGQFSQELGMRGAVQNREMADKLYKQALEDERNAWKSFPPNVSLLSKALTESKEAKQADDQAKEFARAALHGYNSAMKSGDVAQSKYKDVDPTKLKDLATNNSPYTSAVQDKLGGYGMKLDPDQMSVQTPMGKFPIGMGIDMYEKGLRNIASALGYSPDDITKGIQEATRTRDAFAKNLEKTSPGDSKAPEAGRATAVAAGSGADKKMDLPKDVAPTAAVPVAAGNGADVDDLNARSGDARVNELARQRQAFLKKMGLEARDDQDARADRTANIFQVVHDRYQSLRAGGSFIETESAPPARRVASKP